jgi:hypothetical protein
MNRREVVPCSWQTSGPIPLASDRRWRSSSSSPPPRLVATMRRYLVQLTTFPTRRSVEVAEHHCEAFGEPLCCRAVGACSVAIDVSPAGTGVAATRVGQPGPPTAPT